MSDHPPPFVDEGQERGEGASVKVSAYVVSRLPDDTPDYSVWSIKVEAAGHGRWAVRSMGECLNKSGEREYEPQPSSRTDEWLATVRWDNAEDAISAALAAEPHLCVNGLTPPQVLARHLLPPKSEGRDE